MGNTDTGEGVNKCPNCGAITSDRLASNTDKGEQRFTDRIPVEHPELPVVLRDVFGISETGIRICVFLMEEGESTAGDLAERFDIDRSTVNRQLNHLAEIGLLEKHQRLLKGGGYVHVYSPVDAEEVRQRLTRGLHAWVGDALELIEDINREKLKALARGDGSGDGEPSGIYWEK